ncbi:MAG: Bax inhibitor-1/YccA family protein [Candidatus Eremiobacteraeota bacterium]|nr:Bax inhibitor-1/YccA family protein [Candidatus Eremiobacteraeota bacterium]MCW5868814.1 Bax inhibitor-1/YccA family protein [Candidatus Eremiobacteraeota bacterium]
MALRSGNPALKPTTFTNYSTTVMDSSGGETMSLAGVTNKTGLLLLFLTGGAGITWKLVALKSAMLMPLFFGGLIANFVLSLIIIFKRDTAPYLAIPYSFCEGLTLGGISALFEMKYPGIVMQAVGATFGTLFCLLAAYRSGMIKPTENFKLGLVAATGGICMLYLMTMVLRLFGLDMPFVHDTGMVGIGFSLVVVVIAALNLVLDFDFIESGVEARAPKSLEWYAAFGLMVTLIWLYLEILNLLAKLQGGSRRD